LLILFCSLILRVYIGTDLYIHEWDERYHALVAKNLMRHPLVPTLYDNPVLPYDYRSWTNNHIWLHKPPLPLWIIAGSLKILGINEFALRLPSILLSTLAIYLTYYIGSFLFNRNVAILAAFLHSINGFVLEITGGRIPTDHIDLFFAFFIELAIFFIIYFLKTKRRVINILIGLSIGLAILCKWLTALIIIPIWPILVLRRENITESAIGFLMIAFSCLIVFAPWQIYIYHTFPLEAKWESEYNFKHITEVLEEHQGSILYHFSKLRKIGSELWPIPILWFLAKSFKNFRDRKLLAVTFWVLIPYIFFTFVKTKMPAYTFFAAPSIFLITSCFIWYLKDNSRNFKYSFLAITISILLILLPIRYSFKTIFTGLNKNLLWVSELRKLNEKIPDKNAIIFNIDRPIEAMFYSSHIVYPHIPSTEQIKYLNKNGYTIYVFDTNNIPEEIAKNNKVKLFK
jgi:4-amino-4-deoxy-L-arabinose transferase